MEKYSKRTVRVTKQHNDECKQLLALLGVPIIEARALSCRPQPLEPPRPAATSRIPRPSAALFCVGGVGDSGDGMGAIPGEPDEQGSNHTRRVPTGSC